MVAEIHVYREEKGAVSNVFFRNGNEELELTRFGVVAIEDIGMGAEGPRTKLVVKASLVDHRPGVKP